MIRKVLNIDGGGIRGIIPLEVLVEIEEITGIPLYKQFVLMSGTSTGSIICGMLAMGVPARVLLNLYISNGKALFKKNGWFASIFGSKYDRSDIMKLLYDMTRTYGPSIKMGDCRTKFISTTYNRVSGRTHFQMSWDDYHRELDLVQVISWSSLSAVHYFGPICVPNYRYDVDYQVSTPYTTKGAVFFDGGQGRNNCTLSECITTCVTLDYMGHGDELHILSLGTGSPRLGKSYSDCVKDGKLTELSDYLSESDDEGVYDQLHKAYTLAEHLPGFHVYRLDAVINKDENVLDALDKIPNFSVYGQQLKKQIPDVFLKVV